jgi:hypothetical protein
MLPASLFVAPCLAGAVEPLRVCRRPQLVWGFHCQAFPCSNPQCFHPFVRSAGLSDPHPVLRRPVRRRYPAHGSGGRAARWRPRKRRTLVEVRNQADTAIYTAGKPLQEHGSRMTDVGRKPVEDALKALRTAVGSKDVERSGCGSAWCHRPSRASARRSTVPPPLPARAAPQSKRRPAMLVRRVRSVAGATVSSTPSSRTTRSNAGKYSRSQENWPRT